MLQGFATSGLHLTALDSENIEDSDRVEVTARVNGEGIQPVALEQIVGRLSLEPAVTAARWRMMTEVA
jgi:putative Mg2+ transporter-C (MgtC) family protein